MVLSGHFEFVLLYKFDLPIIVACISLVYMSKKYKIRVPVSVTMNQFIFQKRDFMAILLKAI